MSKPVFEDIYKFSGRRNRKSYILLLLSLIASAVGLSVMTIFGFSMLNEAPHGAYIILFCVALGFVAIAVSAWASGSQRIRDTGHSGVWILLTLVPYIGWIVSLAICFIPSSPGDNKYGPSPIAS